MSSFRISSELQESLEERLAVWIESGQTTEQEGSQEIL